MNEEVQIKMGVDARPVTLALRGLSTELKQFSSTMNKSMGKPAEGLKKSFAEIAEQSPLLATGMRLMLNPIVAGFGLAVAFAKSFRDELEKINERFDKLGVLFGKSFGDMRASGKVGAAGVADILDEHEKWKRKDASPVDALTQRVKDGEISLPKALEQAKGLRSLLGKKVEDALELAADKQRLTLTEDLKKRIETGKAAMEDLKPLITEAQKGVDSPSIWARARKALGLRGINEPVENLGQAQGLFNANKNAVEASEKKLTELQRAQEKATGALKDAEKEHDKATNAVKSFGEQLATTRDKLAKMDTSPLEPFKGTLQDLSQMGNWQRRAYRGTASNVWIPTDEARLAQESLWLQGMATDATRRGNTPLAMRAAERIENIRKELEKRGVLREDAGAKNLQESRDALQKLLGMAESGGLLVRPLLAE